MLRARNCMSFVPLSCCLAVCFAVGCGGTSRVPVSSGIGPSPALPQPDGSLIPVVNVVKARGWADGQARGEVHASDDERPPGLSQER